MSTPWHIRTAARAIEAGGVIAYPTETVFGLGCNPLDYAAVERILELKQRPIEKGLILVAANLEQLMPYIHLDSEEQRHTLQQPTATPTTWVVPTNPTTPYWLSGQHDSLAVRISQHPLVQALCLQLNSPIVSTSANPAGLTPAHNALTVRRYFADALDYIMTAHTDKHAQPSRIIDLRTNTTVRG